MTTTSDARKRLAENRNTAHPAPAPAPVAVPEDWTELPNVKDISDGLSRAHESFDRAYFRADSPDDMRRAVEETREHLAAVLAELPAELHPEPLAAPSDSRCNARATDPITTRYSRGDDWSCGRDIGHSGEHVLYSTDGERVLYAGSWRMPAPVVAPLPSEAEALAQVASGYDDLTWKNLRKAPEAVDLWLGVAGRILAAGYRPVLEDDEDTVRVPRAAVERLRSAANGRLGCPDVTMPGAIGALLDAIDRSRA